MKIRSIKKLKILFSTVFLLQRIMKKSLLNLWFHMPGWRNWQTRRTQNPVPSGVGVRPPLQVPNYKSLSIDYLDVREKTSFRIKTDCNHHCDYS